MGATTAIEGILISCNQTGVEASGALIDRRRQSGQSGQAWPAIFRDGGERPWPMKEEHTAEFNPVASRTEVTWLKSGKTQTVVSRRGG
jgi:hypothetical protein